jgi:hypothetical protein
LTGILELALGALFAAWFVIAVLATTRRLAWPLARFDPASLLQEWDLFARPRYVDLILLRRDILRDGRLTPWCEVEVTGRRRWWNFVWNPELRARRAYLAMATEVVRAARDTRMEGDAALGEGIKGAIPTLTTVPYLALLNLVTAGSHAAVEATQFMIVAARDLAITGRYDPAEPGRVVFVSEFHRVRAGQATKRTGDSVPA